MTQKTIIEYAIKGLANEMNEVQKSICKGEEILRNRSNGLFNDKSPMSSEEIKNIINKKRIEVEDLYSKKSELEWELC